ncbi:MAG: FtsL-like putative cell division protein [Bacteroidia bacterium]
MKFFNRKIMEQMTPDPNNSLNSKRQTGWLSVQRVDDFLRFVLFLAAIGLFYIWNTHYANKQVREKDALEKQIKDLKAEYLTRKATLSAGTRYTQLVTQFDSLGLHHLGEPPYKLIKKKEKK